MKRLFTTLSIPFLVFVCHAQVNSYGSIFSQKVLDRGELLKNGFKNAGQVINKDTTYDDFWYRKVVGDTLIEYMYKQGRDGRDRLYKVDFYFDLKRTDSAKLFSLLCQEGFKRVNQTDSLNHHIFINEANIKYLVSAFKSYLFVTRHFGTTADFLPDVPTDSATSPVIKMKHSSRNR